MKGTGEAANSNGAGRKSRAASAIAAEILEGRGDRKLRAWVDDLQSDAQSRGAQAARVIEEVIEKEPTLGAPFIPRFIGLLRAENPRVAQACACVLPMLGRAAPAKVAKRMPALREQFDSGDPTAQDGALRTFVALCAASVAYQKRLIDLFERALGEADPERLLAWTPVVLPTLKGEPYAQLRETVEQRLPYLPAAEGQALADHLGIKWRPAATG